MQKKEKNKKQNNHKQTQACKSEQMNQSIKKKEEFVTIEQIRQIKNYA